MEFKYTLEDNKQIQQDIIDIFTNYEKNAKGPAKIRVLTRGAPKSIQKIIDCVARNAGENKRKMESDYKVKLIELETKYSANKQELQNMKDKEKTNKIKVFCY